MIPPGPAAERCPLAEGVLALAGGFAFLNGSRTLVCADAHFGYEDVVGGVLPLWSTTEIAATVAIAARRAHAREIVFLGDLVHGVQMSTGAGEAVRGALAMLAEVATVTLIAGNHEGRSRGRALLGATVESCERDGWLLLHGDKPPRVGVRAIIGHLHPSLHLGGRANAPVFLAARDLVVVPALTPYSEGLDVFGEACRAAVGAYGVAANDLHVVAAANDRVYPFGSLRVLREALARPAHPSARGLRTRRLSGDGG